MTNAAHLVIEILARRPCLRLAENRRGRLVLRDGLVDHEPVAGKAS